MKLIAGLAAVALAATTLATPAGAAAPAQPTATVADWITGQLEGGLALGDWGADVGLSIDAGLALEAIGRTDSARTVGDAISARLVSSADVPYGYAQSVEPNGSGKYANATAKAAAFTTRIGRDPRTAHPAIDLIAQLEELTDDSARASVRVSG